MIGRKAIHWIISRCQYSDDSCSASIIVAADPHVIHIGKIFRLTTTTSIWQTVPANNMHHNVFWHDLHRKTTKDQFSVSYTIIAACVVEYVCRYFLQSYACTHSLLYRWFSLPQKVLFFFAMFESTSCRCLRTAGRHWQKETSIFLLSSLHHFVLPVLSTHFVEAVSNCEVESIQTRRG